VRLNTRVCIWIARANVIIRTTWVNTRALANGKRLIIGESAVGKSSLVLRFVNNEFQDNREPTIGGKLYNDCIWVRLVNTRLDNHHCHIYFALIIVVSHSSHLYHVAAFLTQKCRLDDKVIKFELWDTAGQERFHSLAPMYYRNAQAAIVAYDITKAV